MPWNDLTSNQLVSYTDAQGGGFTLKAGQSNVTSNQLMSKQEAIAKYNLNESNLSGYTNSQLVQKSVLVAATIPNIIVGGSFSTYRGVSRTGLSLLNTDAGANASFNPPAYTNGVYGLGYQSTGKLVYGGGTFSGDILRRLNTDFTQDGTFTASGVDGILRMLVVQSDNKLIVGGNFLTRRLLVDGANDSSFSASSFTNQPYSGIIQSDGKIVMVGTFTAYGGVTTNRIVRLNTNGTRDTGFNMGTGFSAFARVIKQQVSSGLLYVIGIFTSYNGTAINGIARLFSDGTLDTSFNPGSGPGAFGSLQPEALAIQSDGKIIVGGNFTAYNGTFINRIVRINTNGTIDNTFNVGSGFNNAVYSLFIESDGKIVAGGDFTTYNGVTRNRIAKLNSDGTLDTAFDPSTGYNGTVLSLIPYQ